LGKTRGDLGKAGNESGAVRNGLAASSDDEGKARDALYKTARVSYKAEAVYPVEKIFCHVFGDFPNSLV